MLTYLRLKWARAESHFYIMQEENDRCLRWSALHGDMTV